MDGFSAGNLMNVALGLSGFDQPGLSSGTGSRSFSLTNGARNNVEAEVTSNDYFNNPQFYPFLRDNELVEALLNVIEPYVANLINANQFKISGTPYDDEVNLFLEEIGLKDMILQELKSALYWGDYFFSVNYEKRYIQELITPRGFHLCKRFGKNFKYIYSVQTPNDNFNKQQSLIDCNKLECLMFNPTLIKTSSIADLEGRKEDEKKKDGDFLDSILAEVSIYKGNSVLKGVMANIFQYFLMDYLKQFMVYKNTTRPDLMKAKANQEGMPEYNVTEAIQSIEALLNQGEFVFDNRISSLSSIIGTLRNTMINSVKVVPELENLSSIEIIPYPDIRKKITDLDEDLKSSRQRIIQNSGVPEELMAEGKDANKWEVLSRSNRFANLIKTLVNDVATTVKQVSSNFIRNKYQKIIPIGKIEINFDKDGYLSDDTSLQKIKIIVEITESTKKMFENLKETIENPLINKKTIGKYINTLLSTIDEGMIDIFDVNGVESVEKENAEDKESDDETESNEDVEDFNDEGEVIYSKRSRSNLHRRNRKDTKANKRSRSVDEYQNIIKDGVNLKEALTALKNLRGIDNEKRSDT